MARESWSDCTQGEPAEFRLLRVVSGLPAPAGSVAASELSYCFQKRFLDRQVWSLQLQRLFSEPGPSILLLMWLGDVSPSPFFGCLFIMPSFLLSLLLWNCQVEPATQLQIANKGGCCCHCLPQAPPPPKGEHIRGMEPPVVWVKIHY